MRLLAATCIIAFACTSQAADDDVAATDSAAVPDSGNAIAAVPAAACTGVRTVATLRAPILEASGISASRTHPGVLWVHNDSDGDPQLYSLDYEGSILAHIEVSGLTAQTDWEDIAIGPCSSGDCLYIGAIGDNLHRDTMRAVLRIAEPAPDAREAGTVESFPYRLPDGPSDAEALFVLPDTSIWIITKGRNRPAALYRYPAPLTPGVRVTLEKVQEIGPANAQLPDLVTGASATPDGRTVVVRTYSSAYFHPFDSGRLQPATARLDLTPLGEPQGEGVAVMDDGTLFFVSELGPPTAGTASLSRASCTLR